MRADSPVHAVRSDPPDPIASGVDDGGNCFFPADHAGLRNGRKQFHRVDSPASLTLDGLLPAPAQEIGDRREVPLNLRQGAIVDEQLSLISGSGIGVAEFAADQQIKSRELDIDNSVMK